MRYFTDGDNVNDQNHAPPESDVHFYCQNCGVRTTNGGICRRCVDLPSCVVCKRHIPSNCFDGVDNRVCQVRYGPYFFTFCILISLSHHVVNFYYYYILRLSFQACGRKKERPTRVTRAVSDTVTEVDIPTVEADSTFEHFVRRNREHISRTIDEHLERYGYVTKTVFRLCHYFSHLHFAIGAKKQISK